MDVALKIDAYRSGNAAFAGFSTPNTSVILFQSSDVGVAGFLDFRLGLSFRETIAARHRGIPVVLAGAVDRVVVWSRLRRRILR